MIRLLIVDDSPLMRRLLRRIFEEAGDFAVETARSADEALSLVRSFDPEVVTLDVHMPDMDGLNCLDRIMLEAPRPVVMLSSLTTAGAEETVEALALGAVGFIAKPRGPISIEIEKMAAELVERVREAAKARIPATRRLRDRVRARAGSARSPICIRSPAPRLDPRGTKRERSPATPMAHARDIRPSVPVQAVLVGVSTGGPPALDALLAPLPADFPWPIVVAQHMPASFTGALARRLDRLCALNVLEVSAPVPLRAGHVFIGRGDADLIFSRRRGTTCLLAAPARPDLVWHPSVDRLVTSARETLDPSTLLGILMTGMGNDGAVAMADLKAAGGRAIAQDEASSVVWGMPGALVAAGGADLVVPLDAIAPLLISWARS